MQAQLQEIEVEALVGSDDDLAIDDTARRQPLEQCLMQFWKIAIERLQVAALYVNGIVAAENDGPEPVPFRFEEKSVSGGDLVGELRQHRLDRGFHHEGSTRWFITMVHYDGSNHIESPR